MMNAVSGILFPLCLVLLAICQPVKGQDIDPFETWPNRLTDLGLGDRPLSTAGSFSGIQFASHTGQPSAPVLQSVSKGNFVDFDTFNSVLERLESTEAELAAMRKTLDAMSYMQDTPAGASEGGGGGAGENDNGTDPSNFQRRVFFYNDFFRIQAVGKVNITYLFMAFPTLRDESGRARGIFNVEIPTVFADLDNPVPVNTSGLGDIRFRFFLQPRVHRDVLICGDTLKPLIGTEFYIPSASNTLVEIPDSNVFLQRSLGTGQFRFAPALGFVYSPRPNIIFAPMYLHNFSVGGSDSPLAPGINQGWWRIFLMYAFPTGTYLLPELQIITDYKDAGRTDLFFRPEFGQVLSRDGTTVYVKPGMQFNHLDRNRDWGIEVGLRLTF